MRTRTNPLGHIRVLALAGVLLAASCGNDDASSDETAAPSPATTAPSSTSVATATTAATPTPTAAESAETSGAPGTGAAATTAPGAAPVPGGELVLGTLYDAFGLEPATFVGGVTDGHLSYALYDGLMSYTPDGSVEPWLAESMTTDDQVTWTMRLRPDIRFQDGTPFDAEAVRFNIARHQDPATGSRAINNARHITAMTVVDPLTIEFTLAFPWASFDDILAGNLGLMASPTAVAAGTINTQPVGTGPFTLLDRVQGDRITVVRNDDYWREGEPYLDRVTYRVILDDSVRAASVANGEISAAQSIRADELARAADTDGLTSTITPGHAHTIHMNSQAGPTSDVRVRQALAMALDYDALNDVVFEGSAPADHHFIGEENPFYDASIEFPGYDPDAARALIEEYEAENGPVSFVFSCYTQPVMVQMVQLVAQMWSQVGVDAEVQLSDQTTLVIKMLSGDFSVGCLALGAETNDADLVFYNQLHSASTSNYGKYADPEMDEALTIGRTSGDVDERRAAYSTVQQLMARDMPTIEWSKSPWGWVMSDDVHGLVSLPGAEFHPGSVYIDPA